MRHITTQRRLAYGTAMITIAFATAAHAQSQAKTYAFDISAQPLSAAIRAVGRQAGVNLLFEPSEAMNRTAPAVRGRMTPKQALSTLLQGSGLTSRTIDERSATIERVAMQTAAIAPVVQVRPALAEAPPPVEAVEPPEDSTEVEQVIVTATRIATTLGNQPTPVKVISFEEVAAKAPPDITNYLATEVPALANSTKSTSGGFIASAGNAGENVLNLRNIGTNRTLVLVDGRRVTPSEISGTTSINSIPTGLLSGVQIVTGGASAAWGSDAVAGVVNFTLNHDFEGLRLRVEAGGTGNLDVGRYKVSLLAGRSFLDDRAHIEAAFDYQQHLGYIYTRDRSWFRATKFVNNPTYTTSNGEPQLIKVDHVGIADATTGGLINAGPLRGIQFGPNGVPLPYRFGTVSGAFAFGGDAENLSDRSPPLNNIITQSLFWTRGSFKVLDNLEFYSELTLTDSVGENTTVPWLRNGNASVVINRDNAFLDPTLAARMTTLGISTFTLGTSNYALPIPSSEISKSLIQGVIGFTGDIGKDWKVSGYFQRGRVEYGVRLRDTISIARYNAAVDAVRSPTGAIVCRSSLANPSNGCVPLNIMGTDVQSPQAIAWVSGTATQDTTLKRDILAFELQGAPFSTWAGDVSLALGAEFRWDKAEATADPLSLERGWFLGNYPALTGEQSVKEAFVETSVPLAKDVPFAKLLRVDLAGRVTDYQHSGTVGTWKVGALYQPVEDIRFRASLSRDIRAPNINELQAAGICNSRTVVDRISNPSNVTPGPIFACALPNPDLVPEIAKNLTAGMAYSPGFLDGFTASVDYYSIKLSGQIAAPDAQFTVDGCARGTQQEFCSRVIRAANGTISRVNLLPSNVNSLRLKGYDLNLRYRTELPNGRLTLQATAQHILGYNTVQFNRPVIGDGPRWMGNVSATYDRGPLSVTAESRMIGKDLVSRNAPAPFVGVNTAPYLTIRPGENRVPAIAYLDLRASYTFKHDKYRLYGSITNVLNTDPPTVAPLPDGVVPWFSNGTNRFLYDMVGRQFAVGVVANF